MEAKTTSPDKTYDVIVVGAGPAGSTVAREAASRGLSVLVLDREAFPRDKPCGGGVTGRAAALLPFDITPVVERVIHSVRFRIGDRVLERRWPEPLVYLTQRCRLDTFLMEKAVAAGAEFVDGARVESIERQPGRVVVRTARGEATGRTLVGADGVNGVTAKMLGLQGPRWLMVALEGNLTFPGGVPAEWHELLELDIGKVRGGYGWVFPKGDHLNFGVGGEMSTGPSIRRKLEDLLRVHGASSSALVGLRGYRLPVRSRTAPVADGNVLLVGDAAGFVEPFTGEGIYGAFWSGRLAAQHLAAYLGGQAKDLSGYQREVRAAIAEEMWTAGLARNIFHRAPRFWMRVFDRLPVAWQATSKILRGDQTFLDTRRKLGRFRPAFEVLGFVTRWAPGAVRS